MFFDDLLIPNPEAGCLMRSPSYGSEQGGLVAGASMVHPLIKDLVGNVAVIGQVLILDTARSIPLLAKGGNATSRMAFVSTDSCRNGCGIWIIPATSSGMCHICGWCIR
jgi:hypothetical protein